MITLEQNKISYIHQGSAEREREKYYYCNNTCTCLNKFGGKKSLFSHTSTTTTTKIKKKKNVKVLGLLASIQRH